MAVAKDSASNSIGSQLLTMFPERPSGVSWADWVDDDEDEEQPIPLEAAAAVAAAAAAAPVVQAAPNKIVEPVPKKVMQPKKAAQPKKTVEQRKVFDPRKLAEINKIVGPKKAVVPKKQSVISRPTSKAEDKGDRIETNHQKISFDTAVPKPILLNPSMTPNELGLGASRWASAEPNEAVRADEAPKPPPRLETPSPATTPEPVEPVTPAAPAARSARPASPKPTKAAEPGLMASRWAN